MREEFSGLESKEVELSRKRHGENKLEKIKKRSFFGMLLCNLNDPIIKVLIVALFINIIFSIPHVNIIESIGIATSILISSLVSTFSEYSSENAFEKLKEKSENGKAIVKRAGDVCEIDISSIVVGDILILEAGGGVFADATLLSGSISVNESALTGESCEVEKSPLEAHQRDIHITNVLSSIREETEIAKQNPKSTILKGSLVTNGYGEAIVTSVGEHHSPKSTKKQAKSVSQANQYYRLYSCGYCCNSLLI